MREMLRSAGVGMLVSMMVIDPATACRFCGQSWGYSGPSYSYSNESSCCSSPCQSCGYSEVVVSEPCGGCQSVAVANRVVIANRLVAHRANRAVANRVAATAR